MTPPSVVLANFTVNGESETVAFAPHKTLLEVLREDLDLTGTKHGCEPALAHFDKDGKLTLWSSTQTPHYVHRALAKVLDPLPAHHIRVIACPNGGGFGGNWIALTRHPFIIDKSVQW